MSSGSRRSECAVKPTRSTNKTETSRRSGEGDGALAGSACASEVSPANAPPQDPQKRSLASTPAPQRGQIGPSAEPHPLQ